MAGSKIAKTLETVVNTAGKGVGKFQIGVNKILWGKTNTRPTVGVSYVPATSSTGSASLNYLSAVPTAPKTAQEKGIKNFAESGVFNILNALNSVDLCNVLTYAYDNINLKRKPRPEKPWDAAQTAFFFLQDTCGEIIKYIDKYTASPTMFITSYLISGSNNIPPVLQAINTDAPVQGGIDVTKYNTYFLLQTIKQKLTPNGQNSLFSQEDVEVIQAVPGLITNLNFLNDVTKKIDKYASYLEIPDEQLLKFTQDINKIRAACVTVQNLSLRDPKALINTAANYLGVDVRNQIQQLNKYLDVTKIIPTLKQINDSLRSFIRIANQVQGIVRTAQFFIKLALLFYKVFKFLFVYFKTLPIPSIFGTYGTAATFQDVVNTAKNELDGLVRILRAINALLEVVVVFIKYLLGNTVELLRRLEILLATLEGCEAMKDSDVLFELKQTQTQLQELKDRLETYIFNFESKTDPNLAQFGTYEIRVIDEQVVETTIRNRRRRGIALDRNGAIAAQSDLTFATNSAVIIEEVKQRLIALGLVNPVATAISPVDLQVFSEAYSYLDNNDILSDDLNLTEQDIESADNLNENQGLGLQAFINNLKGGKRLRKRTRRQLAARQTQVQSQVAAERQAARSSLSPRPR